MPITRRRRANPPDQPENTNPPTDQQKECGGELLASEQQPEVPQMQASEEVQVQSQPFQEPVSSQLAQTTLSEPLLVLPMQSEDAAQPSVRNAENIPVSNNTLSSSPPPLSVPTRVPSTPQFPSLQMTPLPYPAQYQNGDRFERGERFERVERQEYPQVIEGGRRTARGELFRRPPQPPLVQSAPVQVPPVLQAPTHEITLPMGNLLHLAYNPSYTGSDEARSVLLQKLMQESKAGGRARCWSCGSLAIVYDRWDTRSKPFGEVGIAYCEICGVWSVM